MVWSDIDALDDGLRAVVSWHTPGGVVRLIGRIDVTAHRADALLHPEPHGHEPPGTPLPLPPITPPAGARVHVIGFPGDRLRGLLGGLFG